MDFAVAVAVAVAAVAAEAAVAAAAVTEAAAHRGAPAVIVELMNEEISFHISADNKLSAGCYGSS